MLNQLECRDQVAVEATNNVQCLGGGAVEEEHPIVTVEGSLQTKPTQSAENLTDTQLSQTTESCGQIL